MSTTRIDVSPDVKKLGRQTGYAIAVVVNVAMLVIVHNILEWGWLPFLTADFAQVVPWISLSLIASVVANLVYQFNDTLAVKSTGGISVNLISVFVTYQIWQLFPFDFSAYEFNWETPVRILLVLAIVGAGIGVLAEATKLASGELTERR
ncbi:MAG TPA: hypothetical protein VMS74_00075 [Acidimicrobiia bacterium]|nr:hypothetical protein [Acidimicrobiia bacterium]